MAQGRNWREQNVTIASSGTTSTAVDFRGMKLIAIQIPTMTGATLTLKACATEGGTYKDVYDESGTQVSITATDDTIIGLDGIAGAIAALPFVKFVSASAEASERTITVFMSE